ncbi:hypothetical protein CIK05_11145 [Bdellovibrio sp. qaytius]|nr:hypothetical protein CIK05_11145 [Bdellovibrio sp. qaytius]
METQQTNDSSSKNQHQVKKVKTEKTSVLKKLDPETGKTLKQLKDKINKKSFGRSIRDTEIISLSLGLISSEHIQKLQESTLSEKDRLHIAHEDYVKENGKITLDQFIGLLIRGQISQTNKTLEK